MNVAARTGILLEVTTDLPRYGQKRRGRGEDARGNALGAGAINQNAMLLLLGN